MKRIEIVRQPKGLYENKPFPGVGEVGEFDDSVAGALVRFKYGVEASEAEGEKAPEPEAPHADTPADPAQNPKGENPADKREQATKDQRETRAQQ